MSVQFLRWGRGGIVYSSSVDQNQRKEKFIWFGSVICIPISGPEHFGWRLEGLAHCLWR
ncbi:hypothetical protein SLEP1_g45884 [Rubroshorea leprosula]|uniref:Uncharacterized protein n=1 Tax=Rubroshorea leprosula TaxID=152421 RepID=A0AAV5LKG6_9ROSI|nr:hypothetical protein SLEP1_g45884 [Rubroshorea leprosula]